MDRKEFRRLLAVTGIIWLISASFELFFPALVPMPIRAADDAYRGAGIGEMSSANLALSSAILMVHLLGSIAAFMGLFFFRQWGLKISAVVIVAAPIISYLVDYGVSSWAVMFTAEWATLGYGMALGIAWFTPLRSQFK